MITELRAAIYAQSDCAFHDLYKTVIPGKVREFCGKYPGALFTVALLGDDNGIIRGAGWGSRMPEPGVATMPGPEGFLVLGYHGTGAEATEAVEAFLTAKGPGNLNPDVTRTVLSNIVRSLAERYTDINGSLKSYVVATGKGPLQDVATGLVFSRHLPDGSAANAANNAILASTYDAGSGTSDIEVYARAAPEQPGVSRKALSQRTIPRRLLPGSRLEVVPISSCGVRMTRCWFGKWILTRL